MRCLERDAKGEDFELKGSQHICAKLKSSASEIIIDGSLKIHCSNSCTKQQWESQHCDSCWPCTLCLWEFLDQFQDVLTSVVQVTSMWVLHCHRWLFPPAPAKDLGYDMPQRFTTLPFCFWAWLQHDEIGRPDSSRSPAAKSPRSSAWTWQCNETFCNTWDGRLTSQERLASFQMENMKAGEGYGYVKSWHPPKIS